MGNYLKQWRKFNRIGIENEKRLHEYLVSIYPKTTFYLTDGKTTYDIICDKFLLDCVGIDANNRIIVDHKNKCSNHRKMSKIKGLPGYIVFFYHQKWYCLSVFSKILMHKIRPTIDGYLLRSCITIKELKKYGTYPVK